jgi:hypothetical protein
MSGEGAVLFFHFYFLCFIFESFYLLFFLFVIFVCIKLFVCLIFVFCFNFLHHAIEHTTVRSIAYMGLHSNSLTCSSAEAHFTHIHTYSSAIECTLVRSSALNSEPSSDPF